MWLKRQVAMLPTNERATLLSDGNYNHSFINLNNLIDPDLKRFKGYELYFLSDEEIKEGDWVFVLESGYIIQNTDTSLNGVSEEWKKIIATTDLKLVLGDGRALFHGDGQPKIGTPSQFFLKVFVKEYNKGNIIKEVMVEYESYHGINTSIAEINAISGDGSMNWQGRGDNRDFKLKISKDNTITIRKVKDSWNREEVIEFAEKYARMVQEKPIQLNAYKRIHNHAWIEQNL